MASSWWQLRWWGKRKAQSAELEPVSTKPPEVERRQSERYRSNLTAYCRLISLLGNDAWSAQVRDMSADGVGLLIIQPFPNGTFLGVQLKDDTNQGGSKLLVKVVHATRSKGTSVWLLGCEIIRELPPDESEEDRDPDMHGKSHSVIGWLAGGP